MPVIIDAVTAREKYPIRAGWKTPNGSPVRDCGDAVAVALRGTGMDDWLDIADKNGIRDNLQVLIDNGKNVGQVRMALGRMLRARLKAYEENPEKNTEPYLPEPQSPPPKKVVASPNPPTEEKESEESEDNSEEEEESEE